MKNAGGFYAGQLNQFAILRDEEPHKPVYLIGAFFKLLRTDFYELINAEGVLLDLADAVQVRVMQTPPNVPPPSSPK